MASCLRSFDRRVVRLGSGPSAAALRNTCDDVIPDDAFLAEALLDGPVSIDVLSDAVAHVRLPPEPETAPRPPLHRQGAGTSARGALTGAASQDACREVLLRSHETPVV